MGYPIVKDFPPVPLLEVSLTVISLFPVSSPSKYLPRSQRLNPDALRTSDSTLSRMARMNLENGPYDLLTVPSLGNWHWYRALHEKGIA